MEDAHGRHAATRQRDLVAGLVLGCVCLLHAGCATLYEKEWFATADVRVIHSERHCRDSATPAGSETAGAERVLSQDRGIGRLAASRTSWEVLARQLATENDGDRAVIRPCDGPAGLVEESVQIEIWRTRGYTPRVVEEPPAPGIAFHAPPGASYGTRLKTIYGCLEEVAELPAPLSAGDRARLPGVDATEFFASDRHFPGYAKIDWHFRPSRASKPTWSDPQHVHARGLSMTETRRDLAGWAARRYLDSAPQERRWYAERYLLCLIDHGFRW